MRQGLGETADLIGIQLLVAVSRVAGDSPLESHARRRQTHLVSLRPANRTIHGSEDGRFSLPLTGNKAQPARIGDGRGGEDTFDERPPGTASVCVTIVGILCGRRFSFQGWAVGGVATGILHLVFVLGPRPVGSSYKRALIGCGKTGEKLALFGNKARKTTRKRRSF